MTEPSQQADRLETTVTTSMRVDDTPEETFERVIDELETSLRRRGLIFEPGPDGRIVEDGFEVGQVTFWTAGEVVRFTWRPASWEPEETTTVSIRVEPAEDGSRLTVEHTGWGGLLDDGSDLLGWYAGEVLTPLIEATTPDRFGDWLTDRQARKPAGENARSIYSDPQYHYPIFDAVLDELDLTAEDTLLEVGCGGGAFIEQALESGCQAHAIDHSQEMVSLTRARNRDAVETGRLQVHEASGESLPLAGESVGAATMTKLLGLLEQPVDVLDELHRVLEPGGRVVMEGSDPELRGTPAAPEPLASRLTFYDSDELRELLAEAGFEDIEIVRENLRSRAREAGIPEEHLSLFEYPARIATARKQQ